MKPVSILLRFTRAIREGKWDLYLSSFCEMLPYFGAFDHSNYTRWGVIFLADMKMLPQTAPEVQHLNVATLSQRRQPAPSIKFPTTKHWSM